MKSVIKSYLPLLVWLALALFALMPAHGVAAEAVEGQLTAARILFAEGKWNDLARMPVPPAESAVWASNRDAQSELLFLRGAAAARAGYRAMAVHSLERLAQASAPARKPVRIGYVSGGGGPTFEAFREGLRAAGYVEGDSVKLETRFSDGKAERFPALIAELLASGIDVLVAGSPPGGLAAVKQDIAIPVVLAGVSDPLALARSHDRPSAHIAGATSPSTGIAPRWISLVRETRPTVSRIAVLSNAANPSRDTWIDEARESARAANLQLEIHEADGDDKLAAVLDAIGGSRAEALIVTGDPVFLRNRARIIAFAAAKSMPAVYFSKIFADEGGLIAYGGSLEDSYRKAAGYVDRIARGARPADLAPERVAIELVVNQRTARAQGIEIPASIVRSASKVIE